MSVERKKALLRSYYASPFFQSVLWLPTHPTRHHFRIEVRRDDGSTVFLRTRTSLSSRKDLNSAVAKHTPSSIYFTPVEWLDPTHLRLSRGTVRDYMLTSPLYFDIDTRSSDSTMRESMITVQRLIETIQKFNYRLPDMVVFSGRSGFHVYYWDWDDIPREYGHASGRITAFRNSRNGIVNALRLKGITVDPSVTSDPWRVLRLPGSLHWETGLIARIVRDLDDFEPERDCMPFSPELHKEVFGLDLDAYEI